MQTHPAAELFPLMEGADFIRLCKDIKDNGLSLPIVQHPDGSILDGRNRFKACEELGIKPQFVRWPGKVGTEIEYVLSLNLSRRHLDASQRAMVAAKVADMRQGTRTDLASRDAKSQTAAAKELDVSRSSVQRAKTVIDEGSKAQIKAVESGEKTVTEVVREIRPPAPPKPPSKPSQMPSECPNCRRLESRLSELDKSLQVYSEALEENEVTKPLLAEIKRLTGLLKGVEERNQGLQNEKAAAIKQSESWRRKAEKK